jgi:hypothetical protein
MLFYLKSSLSFSWRFILLIFVTGTLISLTWMFFEFFVYFIPFLSPGMKSFIEIIFGFFLTLLALYLSWDFTLTSKSIQGRYINLNRKRILLLSLFQYLIFLSCSFIFFISLEEVSDTTLVSEMILYFVCFFIILPGLSLFLSEKFKILKKCA